MRKDSRRVPFAETTVPILAPEHLAVCKAMFDRTKDWLDIEQMLVATDGLDLAAIEGWLERMVGPRQPAPAAPRRAEGPARDRELGPGRGLVGDDDHLVVLDPAGGDRVVAGEQLGQRLALFGAGDEPDDPAGARRAPGR